MSDMQVDVPFFLWTRDGARGTARLRALRANGSRLFSVQDTIHLVSDLLGWQVREQDRLVTSSEFVERMPRIRTVVGTVVPYRTVERLADLRGE